MNDICLKILLVGDSSVGKTTLLLKYTEDKFSDSHITTIGVEYKDKEITINNRKVNLQIWDTSGQERYQSITKNFYRNADGILFVFDVTNEETFHHIKNWLITSEDIDKDFKKMIVGNKIDLEDKIVINKEKMEKFGEKKNMKCFLTSAKDGTNVDVIFKEIDSAFIDTELNLNDIEKVYFIARTSLELLMNKEIELAQKVILKYIKNNDNYNSNHPILNFVFILISFLSLKECNFEKYKELIDSYQNVINKDNDLQKYLNFIGLKFFNQSLEKKEQTGGFNFLNLLNMFGGN